MARRGEAGSGAVRLAWARRGEVRLGKVRYGAAWIYPASFDVLDTARPDMARSGEMWRGETCTGEAGQDTDNRHHSMLGRGGTWRD